MIGIGINIPKEVGFYELKNALSENYIVRIIPEISIEPWTVEGGKQTEEMFKDFIKSNRIQNIYKILVFDKTFNKKGFKVLYNIICYSDKYNIYDIKLTENYIEVNTINEVIKYIQENDKTKI